MIAADAVLDTLQAWGIDYFFGCPGTTEAPILDALVGRQEPQFILTTHEITAVTAADGYARATGQPGVALLHANVGLANAVSYIHVARMAQVPLVAINCIKPRSILGRGGFTTAHDHQEMVKQYTKWDWQVLRAESLIEDLERVFRIAMTPPIGPTYLAIPEDILKTELDVQKITGLSQHKLYSRPSASSISQAAEILAEANSPLIIAGAGVAQEDAFEQITKLADDLVSPVCSENRLNLDYNAYPTEESHFVGQFQPTADFVQRADVIFAVGCKLFVEFVPTQNPWIPPDTKLIHLHSEAKEIGNLYDAEVGLCGSVKAGIEDLQTELRSHLNLKKEKLSHRQQEVHHLHEAYIHNRIKAFEDLEPHSAGVPAAGVPAAGVPATGDPKTLKVTSLAKELTKVVHSNTTIVLDSATSNDVIIEYVPRHNAMSFYSSATGGSLGWGMGAALGLKMGAPERKIICVVGDGVFIFGMPALHMAAKYKLSVAFIVINNSSYAAVKSGLLRLKGRAAEQGIFPGSDIGGPDYTKIAEGFGVTAFKVVSDQDLPLFSEAMEKEDGPILIDFVTDPMDVGRVTR